MIRVLTGRVIDGNGGIPIEKGCVVTEDERIVFVGEAAAIPAEYAGTERISAENGSILPGLIEAHVHLSWAGANSINWINFTPQMEMARALRDIWPISETRDIPLSGIWEADAYFSRSVCGKVS